MAGYRIWDRDIRMEGEKGDRKFGGKVYKIEVMIRLENTGIYGKGRSTKR